MPIYVLACPSPDRGHERSLRANRQFRIFLTASLGREPAPEHIGRRRSLLNKLGNFLEDDADAKGIDYGLIAVAITPNSIP